MEEQRKPLLTAREAAEYLRIRPATLNRMDKEGEVVPSAPSEATAAIA